MAVVRGSEPETRPTTVALRRRDVWLESDIAASATTGSTVQRAVDVELDAGSRKFLNDVAGVGQGTGEPVELRDPESVIGSARRERLVRSR
jgi:hypothetical protein